MTTGVKSVTGSQKPYSLFVRRLTRGVMAVTALLLTAASADGEEDNRLRLLFVDGEVTCAHICPKLTHFQFGARLPLSDRLSLQLGWDPGHVDKPTWKDTQDVLEQRLPPRKTWF